MFSWHLPISLEGIHHVETDGKWAVRDQGLLHSGDVSAGHSAECCNFASYGV